MGHNPNTTTGINWKHNAFHFFNLQCSDLTSRGSEARKIQSIVVLTGDW